jgi:hypothetical protein
MASIESKPGKYIHYNPDDPLGTFVINDTTLVGDNIAQIEKTAKIHSLKFTQSKVFDLDIGKEVVHKENRSSKKASINSSDLCAIIQYVIIPLINKRLSKIANIRFRLMNSNIDVVQYEEGDYFKKHRDFETFMSKYTKCYSCLIGLFDTELGGETKVYNTYEGTLLNGSCTRGGICIFPNDMYHEGLRIDKGIKIILKIDLIMEEIIDSPYTTIEYNLNSTMESKNEFTIPKSFTHILGPCLLSGAKAVRCDIDYSKLIKIIDSMHLSPDITQKDISDIMEELVKYGILPPDIKFNDMIHSSKELKIVCDTIKSKESVLTTNSAEFGLTFANLANLCEGYQCYVTFIINDYVFDGYKSYVDPEEVRDTEKKRKNKDSYITVALDGTILQAHGSKSYTYRGFCSPKDKIQYIDIESKEESSPLTVVSYALATIQQMMTLYETQIGDFESNFKIDDSVSNKKYLKSKTSDLLTESQKIVKKTFDDHEAIINENIMGAELLDPYYSTVDSFETEFCNDGSYDKFYYYNTQFVDVLYHFVKYT